MGVIVFIRYEQAGLDDQSNLGDLITPYASTAPTHHKSIISTGNNHAISEDSVVVTEVKKSCRKPKETLSPLW